MTFTPLVTAAEYGGIRIIRMSNIVVEVSERVYSIIYSIYIIVYIFCIRDTNLHIVYIYIEYCSNFAYLRDANLKILHIPVG